MMNPPNFRHAVVLSVLLVAAAVVMPPRASATPTRCKASPQCKPFREIYAGGKELCENMWGNAFTYEPEEDKGFAMWWDYGSSPNVQVTDTLDTLSHLTDAHKEDCHLEYFHVDKPIAGQDLKECRPYRDNACCAASTVKSGQQMKEAYGAEYHWDRCGPLSPQCERFFVEEACFYECEPAAGHYRRFPTTANSTAADEHDREAYDAECDPYSETYDATKDCSHNSWELFKMPIKASYCDAWMAACADDLFCSSDDGSFFSCAAEYEVCDDEAEALEIELNATKAALANAQAAEIELNATKAALANAQADASDVEADAAAGSLSNGANIGIALGGSVLSVLVLVLAVAYYKASVRADVATLLVAGGNPNAGSNGNPAFEQQ